MILKVISIRADEEKIKQIKALAWYKRKKVQDIFDEALSLYLESQGDSLAPIMELYREKHKKTEV